MKDVMMDAQIRLQELKRELELVVKPTGIYCGRVFTEDKQFDYIDPEGKRLYVDTDVILAYLFKEVCRVTSYEFWKTSLEFLLLPHEKNVEIVTSSRTKEQIDEALTRIRVYKLDVKKIRELAGVSAHLSFKYFKGKANELLELLPIKFLRAESDRIQFDTAFEDIYHRRAAEEFGADYFVSRDWNELARTQTKYEAKPPEQFLKTNELDISICQQSCHKNHAGDNVSKRMRRYYNAIDQL